ncbi:MAG: phosphoadenosine phosphosulfate reductase family protein [Candidatus Nitrosotenuis sp.]
MNDINIKNYIVEVVKNKRIVFLFTGDKGSTLLMNLIYDIRDIEIKTIFIDTGFHFNEILDYIKDVPYKIEIIRNNKATIDSSVDMHKCCYQRKVETLKHYLSDVRADCLIVPFTDEEKKIGIEDSYLSGLQDIEIIRPLANITERDIWKSIKENKMPLSKIYNMGYRVIDCRPCTTRTGRRVPQDQVLSREFDNETIEKLKSLGYM